MYSNTVANHESYMEGLSYLLLKFHKDPDNCLKPPLLQGGEFLGVPIRATQISRFLNLPNWVLSLKRKQATTCHSKN